MDHDTALRSQVTERYILGELTPPERDEFEEHLSDCSRCMDEVSALDAFAANAHGAFADQGAERAARKPNRWLDLLRLPPAPAFAFSAALNLALLGISGFEFGRVVPSLEARLQDMERPGASAALRVPPLSRGSSPAPLETSAPFVTLSLELPERYQSYSYSIEAASGDYRAAHSLTVAPNSQELSLTVPTAGLKPGDYKIRFSGSNGSQTEEIGGPCLLRVRPRQSH